MNPWHLLPRGELVFPQSSMYASEVLYDRILDLFSLEDFEYPRLRPGHEFRALSCLGVEVVLAKDIPGRPAYRVSVGGIIKLKGELPEGGSWGFAKGLVP